LELAWEFWQARYRGYPVFKYYIFATKGTPYCDLASNLYLQCRERNIPVEPVLMDNQGDWMKNAMARCIYLKTCTKGPVGILDADLHIIGNAPMLKPENWTGDWDVLLHYREKEKDHSKFCAGVLAFCNYRGREVLDCWARYCFSDNRYTEKLREQLYLKEALEEFDVKWLNIGEEYNFVNDPGFNEMQLNEKGIQILHGIKGPASRTLLKVIGGHR
jgi:hypothetical protein